MIISVPGDRILTFVMIEYFLETSYIWVLTKKPPEADQNCHLPENFFVNKRVSQAEESSDSFLKSK